jgi:hypothetical protein
MELDARHRDITKDKEEPWWKEATYDRNGHQGLTARLLKD